MEFEEFAEFDLDRSTARAWSQFQARLGDHLAAMTAGDGLVVKVDSGVAGEDDGSAPALRFAAVAGGQLRSEVSGNRQLAARYVLDEEGLSALTALGWSAAADDGPAGDGPAGDEPAGDEPAGDEPAGKDFTADGADADADADGVPALLSVEVEQSAADRLAVMSVKALREVFGVAHPAFLSAQGSDVAGDKPQLGIPSPVIESAVEIEEPLAVVPEDVDHLRSLVDASLAPVFGHGPKHDSDGDIPVVAGSALLFIRVLEDAPAVEIFSTIVRGITDLDAAAEAVTELNNGIRMIKFVLVDDVIIAVAHVAALPFAPQQLRGVLDYMSRVADGIDEGLVAKMGGRRAFEDDDTDDPDHGVGDDAELPPELLTLLHLDPGGATTIDPDLAASVCNYDRDVVLRLLKIASQEEIAWRHAYDEAAMREDKDEAATSDAEAAGWAKTVETLRQALRVIVERNRR